MSMSIVVFFIYHPILSIYRLYYMVSVVFYHKEEDMQGRLNRKQYCVMFDDVDSARISYTCFAQVSFDEDHVNVVTYSH